MDNENEFNFSPKSNLKNEKTSGSFGKTVFVPFLSGIVGASLVVGSCFGIPSVREKLISSPKHAITSSASSNENTYINLTDYSNTAISVAETVLPSVVGITVNYQVNSFFGSSTAQATGSGIILTEDGYIVTNNHVISSESSSSAFYAIEEATSIVVNLYGDDQTYEATVIGTDPYTDLAVLKIEKTDLIPAVLGNSDNVKVGEFAMAVGNPLGMDYSVTSGIISAINREVDSDGTMYNALQTDAAINSGNSGGALVNANGEVIGINTLKLAGAGIEGIGFAIPISSATNIIDQLIEFQTVKRPYIGISGSTVDSVTAKRYHLPEGIYVESVEEDSPASKAGLEQSDIITKIEGTEVKSINELNKIKYTFNIGDTVTLTIYRDNKEQDVSLTLAETPEEPQEEQEQTQNNGSSYEFNGSIFDLFR